MEVLEHEGQAKRTLILTFPSRESKLHTYDYQASSSSSPSPSMYVVRCGTRGLCGWLLKLWSYGAMD